MHEEQSTLIFLIFVIVLISAMVYKLSNKTFMTVLLIGVLVALFSSDGQHKNTCSHNNRSHSHHKPKETIYKSKCMAEEDDDDSENAYQNLEEAANQYSQRDFDIMLYNGLDAVNNVYYDMACPGDNALALRMWENGKRSKESQDIRAKFDKYSMLHYFDEELRSAAGSRWWDDDSLEHKF